MNSIKVVLRNFFSITIPTLVILLFILEFIVFRYILPATQLPKFCTDPTYLILRLDTESKREGINTMGSLCKNKSRWRVNNYGWTSHIDYQEHKSRPRIAVIGDSYVQALQVDTEKAFPQLIHERLKDSIDVYSFGASGAPLSTYLHMMKYVVDKFDPDLFLINLCHNDFFQNVNNGENDYFTKYFWTLRLMEDSTFIDNVPVGLACESRRPFSFKNIFSENTMEKSALFNYFLLNLKMSHLFFPIEVRKKIKLKKNKKYNVTKETSDTEIERMAVFHILNEFKFQFPNKRIIFSIDGLRKSIYNIDVPNYYKNKNRSELLKNACSVYGYEFIDLSPYFKEDYIKHKKRFEFEEDAHWNEYGHKVVADVIFNYLHNTERDKIGNE